mmetsp:Transcript_2236/g.5951  ORF Transcript_2236/g.5951 Transcript_2236/m.5951 type:complete len:226 (-) Transcript_2236:213-890(-)
MWTFGGLHGVNYHNDLHAIQLYPLEKPQIDGNSYTAISKPVKKLRASTPKRPVETPANIPPPPAIAAQSASTPPIPAKAAQPTTAPPSQYAPAEIFLAKEPPFAAELPVPVVGLTAPQSPAYLEVAAAAGPSAHSPAITPPQKEKKKKRFLEFPKAGASKRALYEAKAERVQEDTKMTMILRKATLLRERKKLLDEGIAEDDIEKLLPLDSMECLLWLARFFIGV